MTRDSIEHRSIPLMSPFHPTVVRGCTKARESILEARTFRRVGTHLLKVDAHENVEVLLGSLGVLLK